MADLIDDLVGYAVGLVVALILISALIVPQLVEFYDSTDLSTLPSEVEGIITATVLLLVVGLLVMGASEIRSRM